MPDRTLADAVADLRLSDKKLTADMSALRRRVLTFVTQLEADSQIRVGFDLDEEKVSSEFARLEAVAQKFAPRAILHVDTTQAEADIAAVQGRGAGGAPVVVPVAVDTEPARADVAALADQSRTTLTNSFDKAGDEAGAAFGKKLGAAAQGIVGTIGAVTGGFLATSLVKGFDRLTTIQDATASLTVALGDATKAADLLDKVLGVVRGTPFNLDQFALAASNLVSFGVEAQKVPGYLTAIGESAATRGSRANEFAQRLSTIFGQITAAQRISGEDLLQFSEAGINALTILGNAAGKTAGEMKDLISEGVVPAGQALDALAAGILNGSSGVAGATNAFAGTMAHLRDTLTGSIGGFSAATARFGLNIIQPFQGLLTTGFQEAATILDTFGAKVKTAFTGIADSDFVKGLSDQLKNLPETIDKVTTALAKIGPAIAPLGAILGASGLGSIKSLLGPLGSFIPTVLTNPIIAATAAFAIFTPEVREELLPVVEELSAIFLKLAGSLGVVGGRLLKDLTPVIVKVVDVAESLLPLVDVAADFAVTLATAVVPVISLFASALDAIPVSVLEGLVIAFLAFKAVSGSLGPLNKAAVALENVGVSASGASKAVSVAGLAITAAFSGMALTSNDAATQITGALGSIGSVAAGFATGGPLGGAIAGLGVAVGYIGGLFAEDSQHAQELKQRVDDLSEAFSKNTIEVITNADELKKLLAVGGTTITGVELLGGALLTTGEKGTALADALAKLDIAASGPTGEAGVVSLLEQIKAAGNDISGVPHILDTLTAALGSNATLITNAFLSTGSSVNDFLALLNDPASGTNPRALTNEMLALREALDGGNLELNGSQTTLLSALKELEDQANGTDLSAIVQQELAKNAAQNEGFRIALKMAETETGILRTTSDTTKLLELQAAVLQDIQNKAGSIRQQRIREALETQGDTTKQIDDLFNLAQTSGLNILDLVDLGPLEDELRKADAAAADLGATVGLDVTPKLTAAEQATKDLKTAADNAKAAFATVSDEIDRILGKLSETKQTQDFTAGLDDISKKLGEIINATDLKTADSLIKSIADQRVKVQELQADVEDEFQDAQAKAGALQDRIAEARAAGAVRGVALLQSELDQVFDDANKKQSDLNKAQTDLDKLTTQLAAISQVPVTLQQQLQNESKFLNLSIFDLLITAPTEASKKAFQDDISPVIENALNQVQTELKTKGPEAAAALAATLREQLLFGFVSEGLDSATATKLVNTFFPIDQIQIDAKAAAKAAQDEYVANLIDLMNQPGFNPGAFSTEGVSVPIVPVAPDSETATKSIEETQAVVDKLNELEAKLALVSPTSIEADALRNQIQALIDEQAPVQVGITARPLTAEELSAVFTTAGPVTVPVGIAAPGINPSAASAPSGGGHGGRFDFREGGFWRGENHFAHIVAPGAERRFGEVETGGEGYVPMGWWKRDSSTQIVRHIADRFGYELVPKAAVRMPMPTALTDSPTISSVDADAIGRAVAFHTEKARQAQRARQFGENYDRAVTLEAGAIVIQGDKKPRRTARSIIQELADLTR